MNNLTAQRIPSLDGYRALSIIMVVGGHLLTRNVLFLAYGDNLILNFLFNGELGVKVFFVISGFIITHLLIQEEDKFGTISLKKFYLRRALRILPTYFVFLIFMAWLSFANQMEIPNSSLLAASTFTTPIFGQPTWVLGHTWSLSVEEQFYLLWPLTLLLVRRSDIRFCLVAALICIFPLIRVLVYLSEYRALLPFLFITQGDSIVVGCASAFLLNTYRVTIQGFLNQNILLIRIASIASIFFVFLLSKYHLMGIILVPLANTISSIAIAALIMSSLSGKGIIYKILNFRPIVFIGTLSYGLYVWQQFFIDHQRDKMAKWLTIFPINIILIALVSVLNHILIERPFVNVRKKLRI